jgi:hypothetical protein
MSSALLKVCTYFSTFLIINAVSDNTHKLSVRNWKCREANNRGNTIIGGNTTTNGMSTTAGPHQRQIANNSMNAKYSWDENHSRDVNNRRDTNNGGSTKYRRDVKKIRTSITADATQQDATGNA